ncbi:glycosyltransferase family 4 protein [Marivita sp. S2033]|uniref:glycosyltransferase family 4 protein n=1 Tax=Marivita sp. S2033 TaxID=3373187 RepID=UPI003981C7FD
MTSPRASRPRVLVIAEAANPEWVSVPLVGWSLAEALREVADVHLVTQIRNRDAILRTGRVEGRDFTAIDSETVARPLWALAEKLRMGEGKGWTTLQAINALIYPWFENLVWTQFKSALKAGEFDLVHRVTPLSPTIASPIAGKLAASGVPFVLGPLNGGVPWPRQFEAERRAEKEWLSYLRSAYKHLPGRASTLKHAAAIIVGSRHTEGEMPASVRHKTVYIPENGIDPKRFDQGSARPRGDLLKACFVGRLVPYKGADMLISAVADLLRAGRMTLDIIGDGPMLGQLTEQAISLECGHGLTFHKWIPHENVQEILGRSHILSFPSIREFGGGVVLEAMALGVVPLVVDYAGPGELVSDATGYKVPCGTREDIIAAFRGHLERLADDPSQLATKAENARALVQEKYLWSRKAEQVRAVYDRVLMPEETLHSSA